MRSILSLVAALASVCTLSAQNTSTLASTGQNPAFVKGRGTDDYVPGRVVLKVLPQYAGQCTHNSISHPMMEVANKALGINKVARAFPFAEVPQESLNRYGQRFVDLTRTYQLDFDLGQDVYEAAEKLMNTGLFEYVEPAYVYQTLFTPNDPFVPSQYHLFMVQAFAAWDISKGDSTVVIGIIDTGTSFTHTDHVGKFAFNWADTIDGLDNDNDGYVDNFRGWDMAGNDWYSPGDNDPSFCCSAVASDHGVIVSGPASQGTDNNIFGAAVGFNCTQLPVKVSIDESPTIYNGYQGIVYAADHGADILNLSWGGGSKSRFGEEAINYALINKEVMVVGAAGNTPQFLEFYPASFHGVLSCAGTQDLDAFWNTTGTFGTSYHYLVDVCAPARDVPTTSFDNTYGNFTGTSLAAPIACGVAGLVKSHFPNLSMAQVAQRVRVTSDESIYGLNPATYTDKMGRGRVNAFRALNDTTPSVRVVEISYDDGNDGLIQAGDTLAVRVRFINYLDPVTNLDIQLSTPDWGQFELLSTDAHVGDLGTLDTASTWLCPFKIVVRTSTAAGFKGHLKFSFTGLNYTDWEYYPLQVQPNYVNVDLNRIETSMMGNGRWGYLSYPSLSIGRGLVLDGVGGMMRDAGFMVGKDATHVSNNFENAGGSSDNHFTNITPIRRETPGVIAPLEARTVFSDTGAGANAIGVNVDQRTYQWDLSPHNNYYIQEYRIINTTASNLTNIYAGMYMNLDMFWSTNNVSRYDTASRCIYTYTEEWVTLWDFGAALLTADSLHGYAFNEDNFPYTIAEKYNALTSPPQGAILSNQKLIQFISAGPFNIAPGDTHIVAFAVLLGDSVSHMREVAAEAHDRYWCLVRGGMPQRPQLGDDILDCTGGQAPVLDAGAGFSAYQWNELAANATTQTVTANANGDYWVRVTDATGCTDEDYINVVVNPGVNGAFTFAPSVILVGDTVTFTDNTFGDIEWGWEFGDGSNVCPITSEVQHVFSQPGTYQVVMYVGNGVCFDTVYQTVVVDTLVGIGNPSALSSLEVWPNPTHGMLNFRVNGLSQGELELQIHDAYGRKLIQQESTVNGGDILGELDLRDYPKGVYFVSAKSSGQMKWAKVVLQ